MSGATSAPEVVDALIALWSRTAGIPKVLSGPTVSNIPKSALHVAADFAGDAIIGATITGDSAWASLGNYAQDEIFTIPCVVFVWQGRTDEVAVRSAAFAVFRSAQAAVRLDPSLGLPTGVIRALVNRWALTTSQAEGGAIASVSFTVEVQGRITA